MTIQTVKGSRSPRWALWAKMLIPCNHGIPYLFRLRIIQTPWFGVYLHDIYEKDADRDPHNHPWPFISIILRGSYTERFYPNPSRTFAYRPQHWKRWSIHKMDRDTAHRIVWAEKGLKTLILVGPRHSDGWGFFTKDGWVHWKQYEELKQLPPKQEY